MSLARGAASNQVIKEVDPITIRLGEMSDDDSDAERELQDCVPLPCTQKEEDKANSNTVNKINDSSMPMTNYYMSQGDGLSSIPGDYQFGYVPYVPYGIPDTSGTATGLDDDTTQSTYVENGNQDPHGLANGYVLSGPHMSIAEEDPSIYSYMGIDPSESNSFGGFVPEDQTNRVYQPHGQYQDGGQQSQPACSSVETQSGGVAVPAPEECTTTTTGGESLPTESLAQAMSPRHFLHGGSNSAEAEEAGGGGGLLYPAVYVSTAGLLTIMLKYDVAVEMAADRTLRLINHRHKCVAASNSEGNSSCLYHTAARIWQEGTTVEAELYWERRARLSTEGLLLSAGKECLTLPPHTGYLDPGDPAAFHDLSKDLSINLLFSSKGYGPHMLPQYQAMTREAVFDSTPDGGITVDINGVHIRQEPQGNVLVRHGPKQLRASPAYGFMQVETHFVNMRIEMNWGVKVRRGRHKLHASFVGMVLTDGEFICGFDQLRKPFCQHYSPEELPHIGGIDLDEIESDDARYTPDLAQKSSFMYPPKSSDIQVSPLASDKKPSTGKPVNSKGMQNTYCPPRFPAGPRPRFPMYGMPPSYRLHFQFQRGQRGPPFRGMRPPHPFYRPPPSYMGFGAPPHPSPPRMWSPRHPMDNNSFMAKPRPRSRPANVSASVKNSKVKTDDDMRDR